MMASFLWILLIAYLGVSTPLTYWSVRADIPKIQAEYGRVNSLGLAFAIVAIWLVSPVLLAIYFYREARK